MKNTASNIHQPRACSTAVYAARRYIKANCKPQARGLKPIRRYSLLTHFEGHEAAEVKVFLDAIRNNGTTRISASFVRNAILTAVRKETGTK